MRLGPEARLQLGSPAGKTQCENRTDISTHSFNMISAIQHEVNIDFKEFSIKSIEIDGNGRSQQPQNLCLRNVSRELKESKLFALKTVWKPNETSLLQHWGKAQPDIARLFGRCSGRCCALVQAVVARFETYDSSGWLTFGTHPMSC